MRLSKMRRLIRWVNIITLLLLTIIFSGHNISAGQIAITITVVDTPKIFLEKSEEVTLAGKDSPPVPGATITYHIIYDNDGKGTATNIEVFNVLPDYVSYVIDSAEAYNSPHLGEIEVEYKDTDGQWHPADFDNLHPGEVKEIKWIISTDISPDDGDSQDSAQDESPGSGDNDAGTVRYKVTID
ncbi:MAG: hypothetical protein AB1797_03665 [bacterium]